MSKVHVIAEAGTNHGGDIKVAFQLIDAAVLAGADSVKFQIIYPAGLYLPEFFRGDHYESNAVFQQRAAMMLSDEQWKEVAAYAASKKIAFSASVFDKQGLDLLVGLKVPYLKIASCDLNNSPYLRQVAERGLPMIVSTGMANLGEIERAVNDVVSTGNTQLVLMHCVSVYPVKTEMMNLTFLDVLKTAFGFPVGLSDHTERNIAAMIGVSKGVTHIEKHLTLDRKSVGFDHSYAMEPEMLKAYIEDVRSAEGSLVPGKLLPEERNVKARARRGIWAAKDLPVGHVLTAEDVLIVRPENELSPSDLYSITGKVLARKVSKFEGLSRDQLTDSLS